MFIGALRTILFNMAVIVVDYSLHIMSKGLSTVQNEVFRYFFPP